MRKTLEEVYGADKVSLVSASLRWLNHHSAMKPECNGKSVTPVVQCAPIVHVNGQVKPLRGAPIVLV